MGQADPQEWPSGRTAGGQLAWEGARAYRGLLRLRQLLGPRLLGPLLGPGRVLLGSSLDAAGAPPGAAARAVAGQKHAGQGRGDSGSPTHDAERPEGSPGHPFFYGWRNRGPDRKWAAPQWAGPPGTQQDSPECPMFTPGAWPWPPRSVSQSPSLRSPRSVRQPHLQRPVAGWHKPAGRASLGRVLMPRGLATVHGGGRPAERRRPRAGRKGRTGQGERWLSLGSLPQPLRLRDVSGRGRPAGGAGLNPHALV